jgi:hypothetical protein
MIPASIYFYEFLLPLSTQLISPRLVPMRRAPHYTSRTPCASYLLNFQLMITQVVYNVLLVDCESSPNCSRSLPSEQTLYF